MCLIITHVDQQIDSVSLSPSLLPTLSSSLPPFSPVVAGIPVTEHLELNVVPLAVRLTEKFYQTMQDFFLPRQEGEGREGASEPDHSHIFGGVQRESCDSHVISVPPFSVLILRCM